MSRSLILGASLLALTLATPASAEGLVGSWRATSLVVTAETGATADLIALGGALFATLDEGSRYVLTSEEPGDPERSAEAGTWTRRSATEIAIRPDGAAESLVLLAVVEGNRLTLAGPIRVDLDGDGVEDAASFEAQLAREEHRVAEGDGIPGAWVRAGGRIRTYRLHRPTHAAEAGPLPLALVLHGQGSDGDDIRSFSGLDAVAEDSGFAVAYPDGVGREWAADCDCSGADALGVDDLELGERLIDQLAGAGWVDPERVVVAGFSQGALMSQRFACERSERVVGLVAVAGGFPTRVADRCQPARPLSVTLFHGTADPRVPYDGQPGILSAPDTLARWGELGGCAALSVDPAPDRTDDGTLARIEAYGDCAEGTATALVALEGGGHTWPGSTAPWPPELGVVSRDVSASEAIAAMLAGSEP